MVELFAGYSISQIIIFIIVFALAVKEGISIFEFFYSRSKTHFSEEFDAEQETADMKKDIEALYKKIDDDNKRFDSIDETLKEIKSFCKEGFEKQETILNNLIDSDKDDIKGFIVREYHYFMENRGWIDDFSLDVLERRYEHYVNEGGNSYIKDLMTELRKLPKHPPK